MISYPRDSSGPHVSSAPSTSESPGNGGTISIGPWPLKGGSFSRKSPGHNCRNSVGPWPLKRSHSSEVKQPHNGPLQIIQDLREVNGGGLSAALKAAVDEEGALGADRAGADDGWPTTRDSKPDSGVVADQYLLVLALLTATLIISPLLLTLFSSAQPPSAMSSAQNASRCITTLTDPPPLWKYAFFIGLILLPCAAIGGIIGIAFRVTLYVKDIELGRYEIPEHHCKDTSRMGWVDFDGIWAPSRPVRSPWSRLWWWWTDCAVHLAGYAVNN